jgi:hypothetical protein
MIARVAFGVLESLHRRAAGGRVQFALSIDRESLPINAGGDTAMADL